MTEIVQQYPPPDEEGAKSMRLNHPDWEDVHRTVYAKGVITDFEQIQNGPNSIKSKAKVNVEIDGELVEFDDYVPIFFHPRAQYWDDPESANPRTMATDFNLESKFFEHAWMSFRGGEEVAVMLCATEDDPTLRPFAVLGFVDGVPRIGELIFKINCPATYIFINNYGGSVTYPSMERSQHFRIKAPSSYQALENLYGDENEDMQGPDGNPLQLEKTITYINNGYKSFYYDLSEEIPGLYTKTYEWYYYKFLIDVGPFLIILQVMYYNYTGIFNGSLLYQYCYTQECNVQTLINTPENRALAEVSQYIMDNRIVFIGWTSSYGQNPIWETHWDTFDGSFQEPRMQGSIHYWANNYFTGIYFHYRPDWGQVTFNVRPHTKAELQAAGMWPYEE